MASPYSSFSPPDLLLTTATPSLHLIHTGRSSLSPLSGTILSTLLPLLHPCLKDGEPVESLPLPAEEQTCHWLGCWGVRRRAGYVAGEAGVGRVQAPHQGA